MDDGPFSSNAMLSAFLSPEAVEAPLGLQSFLFPFPVFTASHRAKTCHCQQAISRKKW